MRRARVERARRVNAKPVSPTAVPPSRGARHLSERTPTAAAAVTPVLPTASAIRTAISASTSVPAEVPATLVTAAAQPTVPQTSPSAVAISASASPTDRVARAAASARPATAPTAFAVTRLARGSARLATTTARSEPAHPSTELPIATPSRCELCAAAIPPRASGVATVLRRPNALIPPARVAAPAARAASRSMVLRVTPTESAPLRHRRCVSLLASPLQACAAAHAYPTANNAMGTRPRLVMRQGCGSRMHRAPVINLNVIQPRIAA